MTATSITRPTNRRPQTIKQAKAEYKKHGPRLSSQEVRQLERGAELERRADKIRANERKRKTAQKRRQEREQKEREARKRMGIASQKPALSPHQFLMSNFVENSGLKGQVPDRSVETEKWDEDLDDSSLLQLGEPDTQGSYQNSSEPEYSNDEATPKKLRDRTAGHSITGEHLDDAWDLFLASGTQIQREIDNDPAPSGESVAMAVDPLFDFISTQDVNFSDADIEELGISTTTASSKISASHSSYVLSERARQDRVDRILMPPPKLPVSRPKYPPKPQPKHVPIQSCSKTTTTYDFLLTDFDLSSQDFREIAG